MNVNLDTIFNDPQLYLHLYNGDHVRFTQMSRDTFRQSIALDERLVVGGDTIYRVPLDPLLSQLQSQGYVAPALCYIHHVEFCGATLLARALDKPDDCLILREPFHLRQVGVYGGAGFDTMLASQDHRALLGFSLTMLGKRFEIGEPVIVKGNVPISMIADAISDADPGRPTILLYYGLEDYLAAVLRTDDGRNWIEKTASEVRIEEDPAVGDIQGQPLAVKASAIWLSLMMRFHRLQDENVSARALDANQLFDRPAETILAAARLFTLSMTPDEARAIAEGRLFSTYSKNPDVPYDPKQRLVRRSEAKLRLAHEIAEAKSWVEAKAATAGLPIKLSQPLLGELKPLI